MEYITPIQYAKQNNISKQYIYRKLKDRHWRKEKGVKTIAGKHFFKSSEATRTDETDNN